MKNSMFINDSAKNVCIHSWNLMLKILNTYFWKWLHKYTKGFRLGQPVGR